LSYRVRIAEGRLRKKPATRIPFLSKTADIGIPAGHLPRNAASCAALRSRFACLSRVFAAFGQRRTRLGKKSWKISAQFRADPLASFQQFFAKASRKAE
jgi:hypothetical protein